MKNHKTERKKKQKKKHMLEKIDIVVTYHHNKFKNFHTK